MSTQRLRMNIYVNLVIIFRSLKLTKDILQYVRMAKVYVEPKYFADENTRSDYVKATEKLKCIL